MTLHEAIKNILLSYGKQSVPDIAKKINWHGAYRRKDGKKITASQVSARISKYPELFIIDIENYISLRNHSLITLKSIIDKIAETLYQSKLNSEYLIELLLPLFSIYLKHCNPLDLLDKEESSGFSTDKAFEKLNYEFDRLNKSNQFNGLLSKPIEVFNNLALYIKLRILSAVVLENIVLKNTKLYYDDFGIFDLEDTLSSDDSLDNTQKLINASIERHGRFNEFKTWNIPDSDFKDFFFKLINEYHWKARINTPGSSPSTITRLISSIIQSEEFYEDEQVVIFDPFFGKGSLMLKIFLANAHRKVKTVGGDINENSLILTRLLFAVYELPSPILRMADALNEWSDLQEFADWFVCDPPLGNKVIAADELFDGYGQKQKFSSAIINMALYHTFEDGRAGIIVPDSFLFEKDKTTITLRKQLIDNNYLEGVISLPPGIYTPYSSVKTSLLLIDKGRNRKKRKKIFIYDASKLSVEAFDISIPEIVSKYQEKDFKNLSSLYFLQPNNILTENYGFRVKDPLLNLTVESPDLNYQPISHILSKPLHTDLPERRIIFSGNVVKKEFLSPVEGIPYIQISDLSNDSIACYINESSVRYFVSNTDSFTPKYVRPGSILIAKSGNKLKPSIYSGKSNAIISSAIIALEVDSDKILPEYFIIQLNQSYFNQQIDSIRKGVIIQSFGIDEFLRLLVLLPPIEEQQRIIIDNKASHRDSGYSKDEIISLISELKHKAKGPLGGIRASITRLENYLKRKSSSGESISFSDVAVNLLLNQKKEDFQHYSLEKTFERLFLHIGRIDEFLNRAIQFVTLGDENISTEPINLYEFVSSIIIPGIHYNFQIIVDTKKSKKNTMVLANKDKLLSVFELLLDNAFVHGFNSSPDADSRVKITWESKKRGNIAESEVIVTVQNNGKPAIGLTVENFITKGYTTNSENGGMGMGGPFIKKALQLMGGELIGAEDISEKIGEYNAQFRFKLIANE